MGRKNGLEEKKWITGEEEEGGMRRKDRRMKRKETGGELDKMKAERWRRKKGWREGVVNSALIRTEPSVWNWSSR